MYKEVVMKEDSWDRLLRIRTSGRDDTGSDRINILMSLRHIQFWNVWETVEKLEKTILF